MSEIKWIKIVTDIFDDEKILLIESMPEADSIIVIWFKLLCLAGKNNNKGVFTLNDTIPYTDEMLATIFRRPINTVRMALKVFEQYGMIQIINGIITIPNWSKHQTLDQIENRREYQRKYMAQKRAEQKLIAEGKCKSNSKPNSETTVNPIDIDKDIEIDKDIDRDIYKESSPKLRFVPPSIEQVREYCQERNNDVDPEKWYDFYSSKGWMIGKNKMKDWKAAVRTWERRSGKNEQSSNPFL